MPKKMVCGASKYWTWRRSPSSLPSRFCCADWMRMPRSWRTAGSFSSALRASSVVSACRTD